MHSMIHVKGVPEGQERQKEMEKNQINNNCKFPKFNGKH